MFTDKGESSPGNLIKRFTIGGFIAICLVSALFGWLFFHFLSLHIVQRDAEVSQDFVQSISQIHDPEPYFLGQHTPFSHNHLEEFYQHIVQMHDVIRANIYSADGAISWSSDVELIGQQFGDNLQLQRALDGQLSFNWEEMDETEKQEHIGFASHVSGFIEIYIPIWDNMHTRVLGAVEIYKTPAALLQILAEGRWLLLLAALGAGTLFYLVLFWLVRYVSGLLQQQQQALMESDKLAALGELAAMVSHSSRGPLANIRASAEVAQLETDGPMHAYMNDIMAETDRLDMRIRELLSSVHARDDDASSAYISTVVKKSLNYCKQCIERTQIDVVTEMDENIPAVRVKPEFLQHVLIDLIANALQAMPEGGRLTIKAEQIDGYIVVQLIDTGVGLSQQQLEKAFYPLHSTKTNGLGVGLGLARRVLQRYGGKLELFSKGEDHGATAVMHLPIAE